MRPATKRIALADLVVVTLAADAAIKVDAVIKVRSIGFAKTARLEGEAVSMVLNYSLADPGSYPKVESGEERAKLPVYTVIPGVGLTCSPVAIPT